MSRHPTVCQPFSIYISDVGPRMRSAWAQEDQNGDGRNDVHVSGSVLPQCRGLLPQKIRLEAGRGAVRSDREESGAAG